MNATPDTPLLNADGSNRLLTLDAMRAIAIVLVYLSHTISVSLIPISLPTFIQGFAVEIFYFVTGFSIGLTVLKAQPWSATRFMSRRLSRIIPAYYVSILAIVGLINSTFLLASSGLGIIALHLFMLHGFHIDYRGAINGAYWMLGNIVWFYVVVVGVARWLRSRSFWAIIAIGFILCFGWRTGVFLSIPNTDFVRQHFWETQLPGVLDIYLVGLVCAWLYCQKNLNVALHQSPYWKSAIIVAIGVAMMALGIIIRNGSATSLLIFVGWRTTIGIGLGTIALGCLGLEKSSWYAPLVRYSGLKAISSISYSIFLYHLPVILSFNQFVGSASMTDPRLLFGIMTGAVLLVAMGSYRLVEQRTININPIPLFQ